MLDADLSELYGVTTKRLNEQVKSNSDGFPADFSFQLTSEEWDSLKELNNESNRSQFSTGFQKHRDPRFLPWVLTEHGAIMAATVLNSKQAVAMSVYVVRTFIRLRQMLATHKDLARKLAGMVIHLKWRLTEQRRPLELPWPIRSAPLTVRPAK